MNRGVFVVIEGLDRCGKSTQVDKLVSTINEEQKNENACVEICFPDRKTEIGKLIDRILTGKNEKDEDLQKIDNRAMHLLFSANRWEKNEAIENILSNEKKDVVSSRYYFSGAAYSMAKGLPYQWCVSPEDGLVHPDIVFYLKHPSSSELGKRDGFGDELFEKDDFQQKVSLAFDQLFKNETTLWNIQKRCKSQYFEEPNASFVVPHYVELDASKTIEQISNIILDVYRRVKYAK